MGAGEVFMLQVEAQELVAKKMQGLANANSIFSTLIILKINLLSLLILVEEILEEQQSIVQEI
jgi:hypothetical protein